MAKKNVPYDQEYYDKEIETMPREQLEELAAWLPQGRAQVRLRELSLLQTRLG